MKTGKGVMVAPADARMSTTPIVAPKTVRRWAARGITSLPAGKMVPICAVPVLREDSVISGRLRLTFESMETAEILMNAINVSVKAYLVPFLAFERFEKSMDQLNRSYEGQPFKNLPVVPFIETAAFGTHGTNAVYKYLGLHAKETDMVNTMYLEAYNQIWNFRAANRSAKLTPRARLATDLAPAFWNRERFKHIVPSFDQAVIDGEVPLNVVNRRLPVKGFFSPAASAVNPVLPNTLRDATGAPPVAGTLGTSLGSNGGGSNDTFMARKKIGADTVPDIFAELAQDGITVSLSNIELARRTQAFAKLREQYNGHDDEFIINLLMDAISVPEMAFAQPMLIGERDTVFGMSKRYASDGDNLSKSAVNGATFVDLSIQTPRVPTGGVIMVVAEITPDQLFERQRDPFFHAQNVEAFPHYLRDTLDPEKVDVVPCNYVDVDHATPNAAFGYAPMNYMWQSDAPHIGGKFYRPKVNAGFDEDRQRIWAVETMNPKLAEDFYICTNIHQKPFLVTTGDPFECVTQGDLVLQGNTVFGGVLHEEQNNYDKVLAEAPQGRLPSHTT